MADFDPAQPVIAFADGGSRGNPGPAAYGALLQQDGTTIVTINEFLGNTTNNVAEWTGLVKILEKALQLGVKNIEVKMDSELVVKQLLGQYRVKNEKLIHFYEKAKTLSTCFPDFKIMHVRREYNKEADRLANQALDLAQRNASV